MKFGNKIRTLREQNGLVLRKVAAELEIDTATLSKIELGERNARKEHIKILSKLYNIETEELIGIWLADKLYGIIENEEHGLLALREAEVLYKRKSK